MEPAGITMQTVSARDWTKILSRYREPSHTRSAFELIITAGSFVLLWLLMLAALKIGYWLSLIIALPAAGFLVRLFMILACKERQSGSRPRTVSHSGRVQVCASASCVAIITT